MADADRPGTKPGRKLSRWMPAHFAVLKWLLSARRPQLAEGARATGYSPWHLSRIINSPEFRCRYEEITREHLREVIRAKWARRSLPKA